MSTLDPRALLPAIDALQEAVLDGSAWPRALALVSDLVGAEGGTVEVHDRARHELVFFEWSGICGEGADDFATYYRFHSPREPIIARAPALEVAFDHRHLTEDEIDRSEFYQDFLAPHGLRYYVGGVLWRQDDQVAVSAFQRSRTRGHASAATIEAMGLLLPQLGHATRLALRLEGLEGRAADLRAAVHGLRVGIVLLGGRGEVLFLNDAARRTVDAHPAVSVQKRRFVARRAVVQRALDAWIAEVVSSELPPAGPVMRVDAPGDPEPLAVAAMRLPERERLPHWEGAMPRARAMLVLTRRADDEAAEHLRLLFDLTEAEADLIRSLMAGRTLRDHAARRRVSINTVRTHLARVKAKTGTRTQVELVARVRELLAPLTPRA